MFRSALRVGTDSVLEEVHPRELSGKCRFCRERKDRRGSVSGVGAMRGPGNSPAEDAPHQTRPSTGTPAAECYATSELDFRLRDDDFDAWRVRERRDREETGATTGGGTISSAVFNTCTPLAASCRAVRSASAELQ